MPLPPTPFSASTVPPRLNTSTPRVHLDAATGTPDLSGSRPRGPKPCRINPAFHAVWPPTMVEVSRCAPKPKPMRLPADATPSFSYFLHLQLFGFVSNF